MLAALPTAELAVDEEEVTVTITAAGEREVSVSDDVATAASELVEDETRR